MFNKSLKKKVAVLLTGVMVLGMTVTAFAQTGTPVESEGAGNFEGHVNRKVVDVTLPTVSANTTPFSFIYDAEGLLQQTTAAYGDDYTFAGGSNVYFKTADKTFGDKSTKFTVSNNSSVSVNITLKVDVTPGEKDPALVENAGKLPANYNRASSSSVSGTPSLYLGLIVTGDATGKDGTDTAKTYAISENTVEKTFNVDGNANNYQVSINKVGESAYPHNYEFKIKDGALEAWKAIDFQLEGAANIVDSAKGMTAPDLKVTWNYEATDVEDGGDTPTADAAPSIATKTYTYTSGQALEIPVSLGSGSLKATGVDRVTYVNSSGVSTALTSDKWSYANGKITIAESYITALAGASVTRDYKVTFNDAAPTQVVITLKP